MKRARRRKRNLSSTFKEPTGRRKSPTSTSPLLTRAAAVEEEEDVDVDVVAAVMVLPKTVKTLLPVVAVEMVPEEEAVADPVEAVPVEARKNSAWTRRPSLL